jgi:hypothetical protein
MKSDKVLRYDFYKKKFKHFAFADTEVNRYFSGLEELKNIDKKRSDIYVYFKYAAVAFAACFIFALVAYFPIRNAYINDKYKKLLYTELSVNYNSIKTSLPAGYEYIAVDNYDYLENSLDLLSDNN